MSKGEKTRLTIVQAASKMLFEKGVNRVSIPELAKTVGLSHAAIYKYFSDQEQLFLACVTHAIVDGRRQIDQMINETDSAKRKLYMYLKGNVAWFTENRPAATLVLGVFYFSASNPAISEFHNEFVKASIGRLNLHLVHGSREGAWPMKGTEVKARLIHNLMVGEMIKTIAWPEQLSIKERTRILWKESLLLLRA